MGGFSALGFHFARALHAQTSVPIGILRAACKDRDSYAIFNDDTVEIRLETAKGIRPLIVINPNATVLDECVHHALRDLASFYTVKNIAVKRDADRWFVEALIEAKPIEGEVPSKAYPWGVNICRQRMAANAWPATHGRQRP